MVQYEIEKKWSFSSNRPPKVNMERAPFKEDHIIYQWYIVATDDAQVRVSRRCEEKGDHYTLNIKTGNGLVRKEVRIDITYKDFLALIDQCGDVKPIKKHLYAYFLPGDKILEISQVDDDWWYAEVEFKSEKDANEFEISDFITGGFTDRTGDSEYAMKNYWRRTRVND